MKAPTALLAVCAVIACTSSASATKVTLVYDDSANPELHTQVFYISNWNPNSGTPVSDWITPNRMPMYDDGTNGDEVAGDRIWSVETKAEPRAGFVYYWGCDSDTNSENDWLGMAGAFEVTGSEPTIERGSSTPSPEGTPGFAPITLTFDDSKNPSPHAEVHFACNWVLKSGLPNPRWESYSRVAMYDDGTNGDEVAGDHVWTFTTHVRTLPSYIYNWACDDAPDHDNTWLGSCDGFVVATDAPRNLLCSATPRAAGISPAEFAQKYGVSLTRAAPPRRIANSNLVLFTLHAPAAEDVNLFGDFNLGGGLRQEYVDPSSRMQPAGNGIWYALQAIESAEFQYRYFIRTKAGGFDTIGDPDVAIPRRNQNSVLAVASLPEAKGDVPPPARVILRPFDEIDAQETSARLGTAIMYIRVRNNPRCQELERGLLVSAKTVELLQDSPLYIMDAQDPAHAGLLRSMNIIRVPTFAVMSRLRFGWEAFPITPATTDEEVTGFMEKHARQN